MDRVDPKSLFEFPSQDTYHCRQGRTNDPAAAIHRQIEENCKIFPHGGKMSMIIAMCLFSLSMSITPGPVNITTLSAGANYGFKRAMPFVSGATIGFVLLLSAVGLGLSQIAAQMTTFLDILSYAGTGFICYMGYNIAIAKPRIETQSERIPQFKHGFLMQWLNPKAWMASLSGVSAFELTHSRLMLFVFCSLYFVICYVSIAGWAMLGSQLRTWIENKRFFRLFNRIMGAVLIAVALYLLQLHIHP
jgi:threonine/homoserine/homoserine lactone efflux protein